MDIALSLELFVNGSLNIFNHQTNVDVDNRFTVYGIRDLGTELSPITMLVMMESIQNRIIANGKRGVATWLYIDEFHVLLNSEYSAKYLQQLWKKVRKQGGLCTGITQNVVVRPDRALCNVVQVLPLMIVSESTHLTDLVETPYGNIAWWERGQSPKGFRCDCTPMIRRYEDQIVFIECEVRVSVFCRYGNKP